MIGPSTLRQLYEVGFAREASITDHSDALQLPGLSAIEFGCPIFDIWTDTLCTVDPVRSVIAGDIVRFYNASIAGVFFYLSSTTIVVALLYDPPTLRSVCQIPFQTRIGGRDGQPPVVITSRESSDEVIIAHANSWTGTRRSRAAVSADDRNIPAISAAINRIFRSATSTAWVGAASRT